MFHRKRKILNCSCIEIRGGYIFRTLMDFQDTSNAISYLKYYPSVTGTRKKGNLSYSKFVNMKNGEKFVKHNMPINWYFNKKLDAYTMIPGEEIVKVYDPRTVLEEELRKDNASRLTNKVRSLINLIIEQCDIPLSDIGISGSTLVDLEDSVGLSDMDLLIYGKDSARKLIKYFPNLLLMGVKHYSENNKNLLIPRRLPRSIDGFTQEVALINEYTKTSGQYEGTHFNISLIRNDESSYPKIFIAPVIKKLDFCIIEAVITNDSEIIFVPPLYQISVTNVIHGDESAINVNYVIGSRFLHAQIGEKGKTIAFGGILQIREFFNQKIYVLSLEPWETVDGFIKQLD